MRTANILIVDDSKVDRMILSRAFTNSGDENLSLFEAVDAESALDTMSQNPVDAVFLDINMPGFDGFHVLREIRDAGRKTWPLVFMYSSSNHPDDVAQAYDGLATAYLRKPDQTDQIHEMASSCVAMIRRAEATAVM